MFCVNCGKENNEKARFCSKCGNPLGNAVFTEEIPADVKAPETEAVPEIETVPEIQETSETPCKPTDTAKAQNHAHVSMGNQPVSMGWVALSKVSMVVICIAFTFIGMLIFGLLFGDEESVMFGAVIGFGIAIGWVLIQALITAICQNIYIGVENMNILIEKVQTLSEALVIHTSSSDLDRNILIEKIQELTEQTEKNETKEDV